MSGRLISWTIDRAEAEVEAAHGDVVEIEGSGAAVVVEILRDRAGLAPLSAQRPRIGAGVARRGPLEVGVDRCMVGCTVDCLGQVIDGLPITASTRAPMFGRDPAVLPDAARSRLTLGSLVFDLKRAFEVGVAILAVGPRRVLDHVLRHQIGEGRICILATPVGVAPEHCAMLRSDLPIIHVAAPRDATSAQRWLVPYAAMAIGDALRGDGLHVVVVLDHLDAWRPHVLRFPDRGSWPTQLATVSSRAYATTGSVSLIARTTTVDPARAAAFDTVIDLHAILTGSPPPSSTRIVHPPIRLDGKRKLAGAYLSASRLVELESLVAMRPDPDRYTLDMIEDGRRIREVLRMREGGSVDSLEQLVSLLAVIEVPELPAAAIAEFVTVLIARLRTDGSLGAIRRARVLAPEEEQRFMKLARELASSFVIS